jgi:hypothetical protein
MQTVIRISTHPVLIPWLFGLFEIPGFWVIFSPFSVTRRMYHGRRFSGSRSGSEWGKPWSILPLQSWGDDHCRAQWQIGQGGTAAGVLNFFGKMNRQFHQ